MYYLCFDLVFHHAWPDEFQQSPECVLGDVHRLLHHFYFERSLYRAQVTHDLRCPRIIVKGIAALHLIHETIIASADETCLPVVLIRIEVDCICKMNPWLQQSIEAVEPHDGLYPAHLPCFFHSQSSAIPFLL